MALRIRDARAEDFEAATSLLEELGRPKVLGTAERDAHAGRFRAWLDHPDRALFLAEDDGVVVGLATLWFLDWLNFSTPVAWIPDLVVTEAARSRGAGAALLARCEDLARDRGCWGLRLESANWRTRAHAFYEREGWTAGGKSFHKLLDPSLQWPPRPAS